MATITTRAGKGSPLTNTELDANFTNLNTAKVENTSLDRHSVRPSLLLDFANTKTLDPRITFTRGSTGTFYDGKTVAKAEENLVTDSEAFNNWQTTNSSVSANSTTSPDGTSTADSVTENTATGEHRVIKGSIAVANATTYVFSVFAKQNSGTRYLAVYQLTSSNGWVAYVDLSNGNLVSSVAIGSGVGSSSVSSVGNGWYRVSVVFTTTTTSLSVSAGLSNGTTGNYTGDGTSSIYLWGAQLEQRSSVTAYTATTTAPITNYIPALQTAASGVARFEHNPVTGESLGLEIEEQRTNLALRSEEFDNAYWTKSSATISANQNIAPDGTLTSDQITSDGTNNVHDVLRAGLSSSGSSTLSIYAKKASARYLYLSLNHTGNSDYSSVVFDLETGTAGTVVNAGNYTGGQAAITFVGNGWYRVSLSASHTTANDYVFIGISDSLNPSRVTRGRIASSVTGSLFIWGAQLEAGAFATSYIPTVASQVTRSADSAVVTGSNFSNIFRTDKGTMYLDVTPALNTGYPRIVALDDGSVNNEYRIYHAAGASPQIGYRVRTGATSVADFGIGGVFTNGTQQKIAAAYAVNNFTSSRNASAISSDLTGALPVGVNRLVIGESTFTIRKFAYYTEQLTSAELQGLTTV